MSCCPVPTAPPSPFFRFPVISWLDKRLLGGGRLEPPVADLAAPLEGMPKPFIIQAAGAHKRAEAETGWHRVVFYNTEVFWHDDHPGVWFSRSQHPDWLLEEHRAEPFTYWLMDDCDWQISGTGTTWSGIARTVEGRSRRDGTRSDRRDKRKSGEPTLTSGTGRRSSTRARTTTLGSTCRRRGTLGASRSFSANSPPMCLQSLDL